MNTDTHEVDYAKAADEDWVTFEFKAENWNGLLKQVGCDDTARMDLFSLAQVNKESANEIIWRIVKKLTNEIQLKNASAFIHSSCKQARHAMQR